MVFIDSMQSIAFCALSASNCVVDVVAIFKKKGEKLVKKRSAKKKKKLLFDAHGGVRSLFCFNLIMVIINCAVVSRNNRRASFQYPG